MLAVTSRAVEAVESVLAVPGLPDTVGIRITARRAALSRRRKVDVGLEEPEPGDQLLTETGARIFVEYGTSEYLAGMLLDAEIEGERLSFTIADPPSNGPRGHSR